MRAAGQDGRGETGRAGQPARSPLCVGILLADNFTLSAFSLFIDHLRLAADEGDRSRPIQARWSIMGSRPEPARASCGITVGRTSGLVDPRELDYVVVVGGLLHTGPQVDAQSTAYLRAAAEAGVTLVGLCTGSFILCRAGLMRGRRCCVSWYHYRDFVDEFPDHPPPSPTGCSWWTGTASRARAAAAPPTSPPIWSNAISAARSPRKRGR